MGKKLLSHPVTWIVGLILWLIALPFAMIKV